MQEIVTTRIRIFHTFEDLPTVGGHALKTKRSKTISSLCNRQSSTIKNGEFNKVHIDTSIISSLNDIEVVIVVTNNSEKGATELNFSFSDDNTKVDTGSVRKRRKTLQTVFDKTTVIPFEWIEGYACFYCERPQTLEELRKHTKSHGNAIKTETALKKFHPLYTGLKIDISEMVCEICEEPLPTLEELSDHMKGHGLKCDSKVFNSLLKFKLDDLSCVVCKDSFREFEDLEMHVRTLHGKTIDVEITDISEKFSCDSCDKCFTSRQRFEKHLKGCLNIKPKVENLSDQLDKQNLQELRGDISSFLNSCTALPFKFFMQRFRCFYCSKDFTDFEPLKLHSTTEHTHCDPKGKVLKSFKGKNINVKVDINSLSCKLCCDAFDNLDSIVEHLESIHDIRYNKIFLHVMQPFKIVKDSLTCLFCPNNTFRYFSKLLEHTNEFHSRVKIICSFCGMTFGRDPNYRSHLKRHHNPNSCKCNDCDLDFDNLSKLSNHRAKVHGEKMYKCPKCFECFGTQYKRQKHLIDSHGSGHPCSYCGKLFTRNSFMKDHIRRSHLKEKNSECSVCKERFFDNILLRIHMVKHVGERNFHCDVCGKTFLWKKNLRGHMSSHK